MKRTAGLKRTASDSSLGSDGGGKPPADGLKVSPVIKRHKTETTETMDINDCPEEFFQLSTQNLVLWDNNMKRTAGLKRTASGSSLGSDGGGKPPADGRKVSPVIKRHKTETTETMDINDCPEEFFQLSTQNLENILSPSVILEKQFIGHTLVSKDADKILDIVKDNFESLSDEQIYNLLKRNDLDENKHKDVKYTLWAWSHLMEHNDEKLAKITKGEDIDIGSRDD